MQLLKTREYNIPVSMAFVNYEKTFDPLETNAILEAFTKQEIHPHYVKLIGDIYSSVASKIQLHTEVTLSP